jgi:hypothetical protein
MQHRNGAPLSRCILELPGELCNPTAQLVMAEALMDDELNSYDRFRLLGVSWAAHELRLWTKK